MFNLKLKDNLHISKKGEIWSYDTRVAVIRNGVIHELGKFSSTTSRHVSFVSRLTGLPKQFTPVQEGIGWTQYGYGAKCSPVSSTLSTKTAAQIVSNGALAQEDILWSNLYTILINPKDFPKRDVSAIETQVMLKKKMNAGQLQSFLQKYSQVRGMMDLI